MRKIVFKRGGDKVTVNTRTQSFFESLREFDLSKVKPADRTKLETVIRKSLAIALQKTLPLKREEFKRYASVHNQRRALQRWNVGNSKTGKTQRALGVAAKKSTIKFSRKGEIRLSYVIPGEVTQRISEENGLYLAKNKRGSGKLTKALADWASRKGIYHGKEATVFASKIVRKWYSSTIKWAIIKPGTQESIWKISTNPQMKERFSKEMNKFYRNGTIVSILKNYIKEELK